MTRPRYSPAIELNEFAIPDNRKAGLIGYARILLPKVGIILHSVIVYENERGAWATLPKKFHDNGQRFPMVTFCHQADFHEFSARVVDLVRAAHPSAFTLHQGTPIPATVATNGALTHA